MACVIKAAAVAAALRVMWGAFGDLLIFWSGAVWLIAILTMSVGNLVALRQRSMKRMLAYSSIAHAGYMLIAFLSPGEFGGGPAILYYIVSYCFMSIGAFGIVMLVTEDHSDSPHPDDISRFNGLGFSNPTLGILMTIFLLSLAGLPPGFAGLLGKFYIFNAAVKADNWDLVIIAVINSAISCYYYLRVVVAMYFLEPREDQFLAELSGPVGGTLGFCALSLIILGLFPSFLHDAANGMMFLF